MSFDKMKDWLVDHVEVMAGDTPGSPLPVYFIAPETSKAQGLFRVTDENLGTCRGTSSFSFQT